MYITNKYTQMKVELKKISFNERMSEETNCFTADLYINGRKVGECKNEGHGGCTDYHGDTKEDNVLIAKAEAYYKSLPKVKDEKYNFEYQPTLEGAIDEQLEEYLKAKERKRFEKYMVDAILFGVPNGYSYTRIRFKVPLSKINPLALQQKVNEIKKKECTNGVVILNTNLEALGINI
jgi:hypothetical protein